MVLKNRERVHPDQDPPEWHTLPDEDLVRLAKEDHRAFGYLYQRYLPEITGFIKSRTAGNDAVADEEVKYTVDELGHVRELSKTVVGGLGEAVGINLIGGKDKPALIRELDACEDQDYFERGIELAIQHDGISVTPVDISDLFAVEVDFEGDLERANAR